MVFASLFFFFLDCFGLGDLVLVPLGGLGDLVINIVHRVCQLVDFSRVLGGLG